MSSAAPLFREFRGRWASGHDALLTDAESHNWPPTPSEARSMLHKDKTIMGYSYEKSHPDVAHVKTNGAKFIPSDDWISVVRADDALPLKSRPSVLARTAAKEQAFNWEDPPPDRSPSAGDEDEPEDEEAEDLEDGEEAESAEKDPTVAPTAAPGNATNGTGSGAAWPRPVSSSSAPPYSSDP